MNGVLINNLPIYGFNILLPVWCDPGLYLVLLTCVLGFVHKNGPLTHFGNKTTNN